MLALKLARIKKGWTQEELSKKAHVSKTSICNIEKNGIHNIQVKTLEKIATALDSTVQDLFFTEEN